MGPQGQIGHVTPQTTLRPERDKPLDIGSVFWDLLFRSHAGGGGIVSFFGLSGTGNED